MTPVGTDRTGYDALVIGAGAGGLCAAARLAHHGYRTLLAEQRDLVGGRASSVSEDGFTVNTGAIAIEYGGVLEETFRSVGAPEALEEMTPGITTRSQSSPSCPSRSCAPFTAVPAAAHSACCGRPTW
jgi:phytoene desaturase